MRFLKRLLGLPVPDQAPAPQSHEASGEPSLHRVDMPAYAPDGCDELIGGWRYCATMQMRTPAFVLRRHFEVAPKTPFGPPQISDQMWHGIWVPVLKDPLWPEDAHTSTMASEVGYLRADGGDYLPFLLAVREVSESSASIEQKVAALREITGRTGPHGTPFSYYQSADALVDRVLPRAIARLPVPVNVHRGLEVAGFASLRDVASASDAELLAVKGVGPKALKAIRGFLAVTDIDLDAKRFVDPEFTGPG